MTEEPEFTPLHLVLQPSGLAIALTRAVMLVGRHSTADIRLPMPDVSRHHCRLTCTSAGWEVEDLKSLNGIYINGERRDRCVLQPGDLLRVGGFVFQVHEPTKTRRASLPADTLVKEGVLRRIADMLPVERRKAG